MVTPCIADIGPEYPTYVFDTTVLVNLLAGLGVAFTSAPAWAGELSHARREGECDPLLAGNIHWAVKTCSKHHNSRVPEVTPSSV